MPKGTKTEAEPAVSPAAPARPKVIHCGDNLEQLKKLPGGSVDLNTIDPPPLTLPSPLGGEGRVRGRCSHGET